MKTIKDHLLTNSLVAGIITGLAAALILTAVLMLLNANLLHLQYLSGNIPVLIAVAANLVIMRIYFLKFKLEKTGRGILLITFILVLLFFLFLNKNRQMNEIQQIFMV